MLRRLAMLFASCGAIVAACGGGPTTVDVSRYDRSCTTGSDCVLVTTDACCGCPNAAIDQSELTRYESDLSAASRNCGGCTEKPCAPVVAVCANGACTAGEPPGSGGDAGADSAADATEDASDAGDDAAADAGGDAQDAAME